jgi:hypothetical protein
MTFKLINLKIIYRYWMYVSNYIKGKSKIKGTHTKKYTMPIGRIQHLAKTIMKMKFKLINYEIIYRSGCLTSREKH